MLRDGVWSGKCYCGLLDGQMLAHWSGFKKFYRPMMGFSMNPETSPVEAVEIGEYEYAAPPGYPEGGWFWRETDAGRAYRKLFDDDKEHKM